MERDGERAWSLEFFFYCIGSLFFHHRYCVRMDVYDDEMRARFEGSNHFYFYIVLKRMAVQQ